MSIFKIFCAKAAAVLFAIAAIGAPSDASALGLTPPAVSLRDANGVDLMGLSFSAPVPTQSIGSNGSGISRTNVGYNPMIDNLTGYISHGGYTNEGQPDGYYNVTFMGSSELFVVFDWPNGVFRPVNGGASTLVCTNISCIYTLGDGTVATFVGANNSVTWNKAVGIAADLGVLSEVVKPDGEVLNYHYVTEVQLMCPESCTYLLSIGQRTITSSLGWTVKYQLDPNDYWPAKVALLNASVDYCDPNADTCTTSNTASWPTLIGGRFYPDANGAALEQIQITTDSRSYIPSWHVSGYTSPLGGSVQTTLYPQYSYSSPDTYVTQYQVHTLTKGGKTWTYTHPTTTDISTVIVTDPDGRTRVVKHEDMGGAWGKFPRSIQDENGRVTKYLGGKYITHVIQPDATYSGTTPTGGYTHYGYDDRFNLTSITVYPKGGGTPIASTASYPSACTSTTRKTCNKPDYVIDAAGVRTDYTYDNAHGGLLTETKAAVDGVAAQTRHAYSQITPRVKNSSGGLVAQAPVWRLTQTSSCMTMTLATCVGTVDEVKTTISYGSNNTSPTYANVFPVSKTVSRGDGSLSQTTSFTYDNNGNVTLTDGPRPGLVDAVYAFYDTFNRRTGEIGPDPDGGDSKPRLATRTTYDLEGRVLKVEKGTVTGVDATALAAMTVLQSKATEYSTSTALPVVARQHDRNEQTAQLELTGLVQTSYDNLLRTDCVAQRLNPATFASIISTGACTLGSEGPDGPDRITKTTYDWTGAVLKTTSGYGLSGLQRDDRVNTYRTDNGILDYAADGKGNKTGYTYDAFNRLIKTCYPQAGNGAVPSSTDCDQTAYNAVGQVNLTTLRDNQTIGFTYDAAGRVKTRTGAVSETFAYNNFGGMTSKTRAGQTSTFSFNSLGWLLSEGTALGSVTYGYDAYGRRDSLKWPDNFEITYAYDDAGGLTAVKQSGSPIVSFGYDSFGRRTSITRPNGVATGYTYETGSKLKTFAQDLPNTTANDVTATFGYTIASQLKSQSFSNPAYAPAAPAAGSLTYGVNGLNQMTTSGSYTLSYDGRGNTTSDGVNSYSFDAENRLTGASGVSLSYDAQGRLYQIVQGSTTTRQLYDGVNMIAEYDGGGTLQRRFVHGTGTDEPLVWYEGSGTSDARWLVANQQGSIIAVTSASGAALAVNTYDEYGVPGSGNLGRFQYTGQQWIGEVGLYHYKARAYSPRIGRFLQTDPIGYADGMNWYAYVDDDPMNRTDPTGLQSCKKPPCADIQVSSAEDSKKVRDAVGGIKAGKETGAILYRSNATGEDRMATGRKAGKGSYDQFEFRVAPRPTESVVAMGHPHEGGGKSAKGQEFSKANNGPSEVDQQALHLSKAPQVVVGPDVAMTLYRKDNQDRVRVDSGDRSRMPDLTSQKIEVDP